METRAETTKLGTTEMRTLTCNKDIRNIREIQDRINRLNDDWLAKIAKRPNRLQNVGA